jgi:hypothetical protein
MSIANQQFSRIFIHLSFPLFKVSSGPGGNENMPKLCPSNGSAHDAVDLLAINILK